jgi:hypothetical protein
MASVLFVLNQLRVCRKKTDSPQRANELWLKQVGFVRALDFGSSVAHKIEGVKMGTNLLAEMLK